MWKDPVRDWHAAEKLCPGFSSFAPRFFLPGLLLVTFLNPLLERRQGWGWRLSDGTGKQPLGGINTGSPCVLLIPTRNDQAGLLEGVSHTAKLRRTLQLHTTQLGRRNSCAFAHFPATGPGMHVQPALAHTASLMSGAVLFESQPQEHILGRSDIGLENKDSPSVLKPSLRLHSLHRADNIMGKLRGWCPCFCGLRPGIHPLQATVSPFINCIRSP